MTKPTKVEDKKTVTDEEAVKLLIHDLALLARTCRVTIENSTFDGSMLETAYQALTMCKHVEDRWIKKDDK
jgi:sugar phosphate isomerase/epimerase